ncbi:AsmA-like C-terminal region-containing protein [Algibacter lectus]|uniref:AsmA-like C-terminal region-containing protein n=1 Tax=Algibacter lectus TaxID=221126 RepID=UPI0026E9DDA1|nr:AsmA-like C-terminal region-containing protein [Algibacter lectus]MDO7137490.1 AsmA-like C-terminal region-containing protein [Algibacter lectus]
MKKVLKITGFTILTVLILLIAIPFVFQGKIQGIVKQFINDNVNAQVEFSDVSLSFIRRFPEAHVGINDFVITNFEPFKGDTLVAAKSIAFTVSIPELFKTAGEEPIVVNSIFVDEAMITLKTNAEGQTNYDIAKASEPETTTDTTGSSFAFSIDEYSIKNSGFDYIDESSKMMMQISELNHTGSGTFSGETSELDTETEANVSFTMDGTNYLNHNAIKLDALIDLDLTNSKYTFKENKGYINKLPIEFDGFVQLLDEGQNIDLTFKNPESDFKNFLALIPETYSGSLDGVQTSGDFTINGIVKGINSDKTIPKLDINIASNNASFKYPDLPKSVTNIVINTSIKNTTGFLDDTFVDIKTLNFKIDDDVFKSSASIKNMTKNMLVSANLDGVLNLANITKAYPVELASPLTGILKAKLSTAFDMNAIETNAFERIKSNGTASLSNFVYTSEDMANPLEISEADLTFNPQTVSLNHFKAKTGESDLNANGTINNLLGFVLSDTTLKGNFDLNSNLFKMSDFMSESETASTETKTQTPTESEALKIPAFLDCTINANAKTVIYDNLTLTDVKGKLLIKDEAATLSNVSSSIFDGALSISGDVSTKTETPTFNFNLGANDFDISKSFKGLELLQNLAPIAKILQGKLNTTINLSGSLDKDFAPNLSTVSGNALAELLTTNLSENESGLLSKLENSLSFIDFSKLDLKDLKTKLEFANGQVSVKPFDLKYKDIAITVSGSHRFDQTLNYNAIFNVPAKYLGSDITALISKIDSEEANNITIPVTANIGGSYTSPTVKTDLTSGVTNLTKQLVEIEKQKLLNKGKDKVTDLIGGIISGNKTKTDSTKTEQTNAVKDVLGGILDNKTTQTDSTQTTPTNNTTNAVKNVLGDFLKRKTKDTVK